MGKKITEDYNSSIIETLDGTDFAIGVDKSESKVCVIPMSQIKGYIIGIGVGIGTDNPGDIVTTDDSQELTNKTLTIPKISAAEMTGATTIADGAILTTPVIASIKTATGKTIIIQDASDTLVGRGTTDTLTNKTLTEPVLNTPDINGGTIDGAAIDETTTVEISPGVTVAISTLVDKTSSQTLTHKTLTSPTINGATIAGTVTVGNGSTLTTPVIDSPEVTFGTFDTPAITNGTIDGAEITGAAIDATTTLNSKPVSDAFGEKAGLGTDTVKMCSVEEAITSPTQSITITLSEIFAALALEINGVSKDESDYHIDARTIITQVYEAGAGTYEVVPYNTSVTCKINHTAGALDTIVISGLTTDKTYRIALTFKLEEL